MNDISCPVLVLDGGLGTTLEAPPYNVKFSSSTPLWSSHLLLKSQSTLLAAQQDFVRAGADVVLTATYQASFDGFEATLTQPDENSSTAAENKDYLETNKDMLELQLLLTARACMRLAVSIARKAVAFVAADAENLHQARAKFVALSLGAYGACMTPSQEYTGNYPPDIRASGWLEVWHLCRLGVFHEDRPTWNEIDLVAFETIPLLGEICDIRSIMTCTRASGALKGVPWKPWYISCVFPNNDLKLPDSTPVYSVVEAMLANDTPVRQHVYWGRSTPWGIGINCTKVSRLAPLIEAFEDAIKRIEGEGRLSLGEEYEDSSTQLRGSPHSKWPWLVLCPDGTKNEEYNTSTQAWEVKHEGNKESVRLWDEEIFEIVKKTRQRGLWRGILVGGCCRTSPEDLRRLRKRIDKLE
ncbi:hypothetical protein MMC18_004137 [Xylographa bjoerkii]|nr:hypothetical protein [Xylographa bjoerkii]